VKAYIDQRLGEMREKHRETMSARADVEGKRERMERRITEAAAEAAEGVRAELAPLRDELVGLKELKAALLEIEGRTKATSADVVNSAAAHVQAVIDEIRAAKSAATADIGGFADRTKAETALSVSEMKNMLSEAKAAAAQARQAAERAEELGDEQKTREEGMKALWNRIVTANKRKNEGGNVE
jgi:hypothetical protein